MRKELKILAVAVIAAAALTAAFGTSTTSLAAYGVDEFSLKPVKDELGTPETQAGAHPFAVEQRISFNTEIDPDHGEIPSGATKDLEVEVPAGLLGSPEATERCSGPDFINVIQVDKIPHCSNASVVGVVTAEVEHKGNFASFPLYNLEPPPGMPQKLGFIALTVPVAISFELKETAPYNAIAKVSYTSQVVPFYGAVVRVWGNPADPAHDPFRGSCLDNTDKGSPELVSKGNCPAGIPEKPFLTLPRSCTGALQTVFRATSWQSEVARGSDTAAPVELDGCDQLGLTPALSLAPTSGSAESASGLDVDLEIDDPGITSPDEGAQQSDIRKSVITLPQGMTANPSAAEGLAACSLAGYQQEDLDQDPALGCPQASKVGELEVETPLFEDKVLRGSIYLAEQENNPFNSFLALYFVIKDKELGIVAKLAARGELDPATGQITTIVDEMPQAPISNARFHIFDGPRGSLVTPSTCGPHTAQAQFTSWAGGSPVSIPATFTVGSGIGGRDCPQGPAPFGPQLTAGSADSTGGEHSSFLTRITRSDGQQEITRIDATLPPGLLAKIAGVPQCDGNAAAIARGKTGREELANPSCPAATQIGRTMAGAGVGDALTYVPGKVYLGGPFAGNKLSLIAITPAVTGPFDAGTVALQMGITVDPNTYRGKIDASSAEPIPRILKGIPLRARDIRVFVERPNFTLNPTNCDPFATEASFLGSGGASASASDRFQATNCQRLPFKPKLSLSLKGGTKRGDHPAFKAVLTPRPGDANIGRAVTTLPPSEFIDNAHIQNPCTRVQFNANQCPKGSILGTVEGYSPLLDEPLKGLVYFRSNGGERLLPDIVLDLNGLFHVTVVGFVDSKKARLRTTFASLPDAPISKAVIKLYGGKKGLLVNNRNLCARKLKARVSFTAQNNKFIESQPVVKTSCKGKGSKGGKGVKGRG